MFNLNGRPAAYVALHTKNANGHYMVAIASFQEQGYSTTDYDWGTEYAEVENLVDDYNTNVLKMKPEAVKLIIASSMFPGNRITLAQVYEANGEAPPSAAAYV